MMCYGKEDYFFSLLLITWADHWKYSMSLMAEHRGFILKKTGCSFFLKYFFHSTDFQNKNKITDQSIL